MVRVRTTVALCVLAAAGLSAVFLLRPLRPATREAPSKALVWTQAGATHFRDALRTGSEEKLRQALAATDEALLLDPSSADALLNRARILERFHLREAAALAWRDVLARIDDGALSAEALRRLHELALPPPDFASEFDARRGRLAAGDRTAARELLQLDRGDARTFVETDGLGRWADLLLRGDEAGATRRLDAIRTLTVELQRATGDGMLRDAVESIDRAGDAAALARAHATLRDGRAAFKSRNAGQAEILLQRAAAGLERGGSPIALQAQAYLAAARFWQGRRDEAEAEYHRLVSRVPQSYPALHGYLEWQLATAAIARADTGNSIVWLTRASDRFTRLQERGNAAYLHDILSQVYDGARDHRRAAHHRELALRGLGPVSDYRLAHLLNGMVYDALQRKEWRSARSLLNLQVLVNARAKDAEIHTTALLRRARVHAHLESAAAADSDLRSARSVAGAVPDPTLRRKLIDDCDAAEALIVGNPHTAIPLLTRALRYHSGPGWRRLLPELHLRRGRMHLALGNHAEASSDFEAGIALVEAHRETIARGEQRWGILDAAEELFDEAVAEALRTDVRKAFAYAERKRARSLSDSLTAPFDASLIPADTLLVEYASLPDRLLVFAVTASQCTAYETRITRGELQKLSIAFADAMRSGDAKAREKTGRELRRTLIAPVAGAIAAHAEVAFVTDATTAGVAFAALPGVEGRVLVEDVTIAVSPSARRYLASRTREARRTGRLLVVDSPLNDELEPLPLTASEARAVAAAYPRSQRLSGRDATRQAFVDHVRGASVVHFAGHGITRSDTAALMLTSTATDSGMLDAAAISRLDLSDAEVVVLAACDTARGPRRGAEGVLSVSHAFLQAGAPAVIATLWPVDDRHSARFFPRLHRQLARGLRPPEALRAVQLEWIRSSPQDLSSLWGAVQALGY